MSATTVAIPAPPLFDQARLAVAGFLARYAGPTRTAYSTDLCQYFSWCAVSTPTCLYGTVQIAARPADPRTTTRYDRARHNLDRHASYIVTAFIAGASWAPTARNSARDGAFPAVTAGRPPPPRTCGATCTPWWPW